MSASTSASSTPRDFAGKPPVAPVLDRPLLETGNRFLLLAAVITVAITQFLDATIANVALPHMQAALGASVDSVSWVLTSFIMAGAIFMPITGWMSDRVGSRNLFIGSTVMFLLASAACGAATSLTEMVIFRALQGIAAAFIGPMTQTIMYDISPPSKQAVTMAYFGMISMAAPITGPFIGGYLTEYMSWRWIYYVNLPLGIPALLILWKFLPSRPIKPRRLDYFGFIWLAFALAALQLMLDRGGQRDWFSSKEIVIEAWIAVSALWIYIVHTRSTRNPLFNPSLFTNRYFMVSVIFMIMLGLTSVALSALLPTMFQTIYGYPVIEAGMLMAPRGVGVIMTSAITPWLMKRVDFRYVIFAGYLIAAFSVGMTTTWTLDMSWEPIAYSSFIQGLGLGMVFSPMMLVAFSTIDPALRPEGASLLALFKNMGGSVGISLIITMLTRNQQSSHADIAASMNLPYFPGLGAAAGAFPSLVPTAAAMIDGEATRQAAMIAYLDNFTILTWMMFAIAPLPLLLKMPESMRPKRR
jgi:DHA2 family multidrug resistance protein